MNNNNNNNNNDGIVEVVIGCLILIGVILFLICLAGLAHYLWTR